MQSNSLWNYFLLLISKNITNNFVFNLTKMFTLFILSFKRRSSSGQNVSYTVKLVLFKRHQNCLSNNFVLFSPIIFKLRWGEQLFRKENAIGKSVKKSNLLFAKKKVKILLIQNFGIRIILNLFCVTKLLCSFNKNRMKKC